MDIGRLTQTLRARGYERIDTHISWVFVGSRDVYKLKKPVDFGFLDFTTDARRKAACEAEVQLNRRLSPDVYLGVVPVTEGPDGPVIDGEGEPVQWAVHMKCLPEHDRADVRLADGRLSRAQVAALARKVAAFHEQCRADAQTARFGSTETILQNVEENFAQTKTSLGHYLSAAEAQEVEAFQRDFVRDHADTLQARIDAGRIRDGHGDLRLEHMYLDADGEIAIIDCIEFNDRFRYADVCADAAFAAMDFSRLGHVELSEQFLASYARAADDFDLYTVVDFYESYRAYVRGKIAAFVAEDDSLPLAARQKAEAEARRDFRLAVASDRRSLLSPTLVAVGGIIATGKSTIAQAVGADLSAPIVDADRTRKAMLGVKPTQPVRTGAWSGAYDPSFTDDVYAEVLRRAEVVLASGRPVIVDASFRSRAFRQQAKALAERRGVAFRFVECRADPEVCRARLRERAKGQPVSDGRLEIFDDFVASWETVDELPDGEHIVVDTARPRQDSVAEIQAVVASWPKGLND